ncbi:MAG: hypothetical protein ACXAB9_13195, partial [Candidatus Thorarchaeota archaeon]
FWQTANTAATTITDFDDPKGDLHKITILFTDTNTTIQNNANIVIQAGADFTGAVDDVKVFLYDGTNWVEQAIDPGTIDHGGLIGLADDDHTQYLLADGSRALTGDWDIGDGRKIDADKIQARDGDGLSLFEDGGKGIFVEDGGDVGIGGTSPTAKAEITDTSDQLRLSYTEGSVYTDLGTRSNNNFHISPVSDADDWVFINGVATSILKNLRVGLGTKGGGLWLRLTKEVETTDATETHIPLLSINPDSCYHFEAYVTAIKSDGSGRASYHLACTAYRDGDADAQLLGGSTTLYSQESDANLNARFTQQGATTIDVSVTGIAGETWQWAVNDLYTNVTT